MPLVYQARVHRAQERLPAREATAVERCPLLLGLVGGAGRAVLGLGVDPGAVIAVFGDEVEAVHA